MPATSDTASAEDDKPLRRAIGGLDAIFWSKKPLIGMVHLGALPGSARYDAENMPLLDIMERAKADARALVGAGADALIVENFFDAPFAKSSVPPHTIAAMTRAVMAVRTAAGEEVPIGVNVLRNDARAAIAIAQVTGARFVRINVYVGAAVTDQGIIEGAAREAVLYRRELGADVAIFADVFVKHGTQLGDSEGFSLEAAAKDAVYRGLADAIIVTGTATGAETDPDMVARVSRAVPQVPLLIGSGFRDENAAALLEAGANGAIVGTSLKQGRDHAAPVEAARVRSLRDVMERGI
ncbi:MAG: BtpA/SgcQ family protein [Cytophagales bacterium]|nr:BtpA/SgcQ family protein [Armatimonadota bacterium]